MWLLAYGEFDSTSFGGMLGETLPFWLRIVFPALIAYAGSSALVEFKRPVIALVGYFVAVRVLTPSGVMGDYGPAHVGAEAAWWAWPAFGAALLCKAFVLGVHHRFARRA
ncbi:MAG: hypothetical protein KDA05_12505 [Phycisphaerales bacterium]|nr:hypothetical protein [Phycisphaerales bacterium]MCB9840922.1 hypothetical protein [Phycisphaeraceae bacterium]